MRSRTMRCGWVSIIATGLCISLVPACAPLLRPPAPMELPALPTAQREDQVGLSQAGATAAAPSRPDSGTPTVKAAALKETLIDQVHYPATASASDLIPEPRNPAEGLGAAKVVPPPQPDRQAEPHPEAKSKPAEDPPLVQALRCLLDKQPAEAVAWLGSFDKPSQELLLCLLPLAVRVTEGGWQRYDSREVSAVVDQLNRVADPLRPRAELKIKKMYLYSDIEGYGKYRLIPDGYGFRPGEYAKVYVELQNLSDQRQGQAYSIHLLTTVAIRDFNGARGWIHVFDDPGPDNSQSERHDFYQLCKFQVKKDLRPGLYTLYLEITDVPTGRKASHTLDFRVISAYGKGGW